MHQAVAGRLGRFAMMAAFAALALLAPLPLHAQASAAIGTLAGHDASVEHPAPGAANNTEGTPVGNGSVIVVHSVKAHLQLTAGDAISICGPAKFTILQSGNALTLALEFGSLHISLQNTATPLGVYTPFFTALPQSTEDGSPEFIIGLDANGIFCARAIHGGVKLEQQLTGHSLVVPEPSETFLHGGDITPLRDPPGHCECVVTLADVTPAAALPRDHANAAPAAGQASTTSASSEAPSGTPAKAAPPAAVPDSAAAPSFPKPMPTPEPPITPSPSPSANSTSPSGATKVVIPALAFDYASRNTVMATDPDAAALLEESRVSPGWVFNGHVGKGSNPAAASDSHSHATTQSPPVQTHESFWSKLKHLFGGRD
jgi:hypothetical protein